jgi:hypothetical protein
MPSLIYLEKHWLLAKTTQHLFCSNMADGLIIVRMKIHQCGLETREVKEPFHKLVSNMTHLLSILSKLIRQTGQIYLHLVDLVEQQIWRNQGQ